MHLFYRITCSEHEPNDLVEIVRVITDPEVRKAVSSWASKSSRNKLNWRRDIKTASATFRGHEPYMVDGFANQLFEEMNALNINQGEIKKFQTVFDELIRNAFNHGCKEEQGCKVKIKCTYSVWFIKVEISDTGKGFDFNHQLVQTDTDIHGLQVVRRLANRISANRKGNSLTALLLNTQELNFSTCEPTVHR